MKQYIGDQQRMREQLRTVDGKQYIGDRPFLVKDENGGTIVLMDHDKVIAMAKRFLTIEYNSDRNSEFQQLASDLDDYLRRYDLGGVAYDFVDTYEVEQDGSGAIFDEAKLHILLAEIGEEALEKAIGLAEATLNSYRAMASSIGQPAGELEPPQQSDWRMRYVLQQAMTRVSHRDATQGDRE